MGCSESKTAAMDASLSADLENMSLLSSSITEPSSAASTICNAPTHRCISRQKSRILTPSPDILYNADGFLHNDTNTEDQYASPRGDKTEDECEVKAAYKIPSSNLSESNKKFLWTPPLFLRSPIAGIYHCALPNEENFPYLRTLKLKSILALPIMESQALAEFIRQEGIHHYVLKLDNTLGGISSRAVHKAVEVLLEEAPHPVLFFSSLGKHRVGCVLAALRKATTDWSNQTLIDEYKSLAGKYHREQVIDFIATLDDSAFRSRFKGAFEGDIEEEVYVMEGLKEPEKEENERWREGWD